MLNKVFTQMIETKEKLEYYVLEFASPTFKVKEKISNIAHPLFEHILKLAYLCKNDRQVQEHWAGEIMTWLSQCFNQRLKNTNKKPINNQVVEWLFEDFKESEDLIEASSLFKSKYDSKLDKVNAFNSLKLSIPQLVKDAETDNLTKDKVIEIVLKYF